MAFIVRQPQEMQYIQYISKISGTLLLLLLYMFSFIKNGSTLGMQLMIMLGIYCLCSLFTCLKKKNLESFVFFFCDHFYIYFIYLFTRLMQFAGVQQQTKNCQNHSINILRH